MRFFVISEKTAPIAVVFHDYKTGVYGARSKIDSFSLIFDALCAKKTLKLSKIAYNLKLISYNYYEYLWIDSVLLDIYSLCPDWKIVDSGETSDIDQIIKKHLS
jgi:hypothetical protein